MKNILNVLIRKMNFIIDYGGGKNLILLMTEYIDFVFETPELAKPMKPVLMC